MTDRLRRDWDRVLVRMTVYSFATIMDVVLSSVLFVCTVRTAEITQSSMATGGLYAVWAGVYLVSSLGAGHMVSRRNVGWIIVASCLGAALLAGAYVNWTGLRMMYVLTALQGVATAFFFTPFQVFMKLVDEGQNKGVARSSGLYVFSWSAGFALGPFIAGFLWRQGWQVCHLFNAAALIAMAIGVYLLKHHADAAPPPAAAATSKPVTGNDIFADSAALVGPPDLAWMAWLFSGLGCMVVTMIRSHFPVSGEHYDLSKPGQGVVLCLLSATQALVGLLLGWSRSWMYRPWPIVGFALFGAVGLVLFAAGRNVSLFLPAAACFGVYSGSFYFYFIYHVLIHPTRSARYVSINEAVVGVAGIAGPALGGALADRVGLAVPYAAGAALVLGAVAVQAWLHSARVPRCARMMSGF